MNCFLQPQALCPHPVAGSLQLHVVPLAAKIIGRQQPRAGRVLRLDKKTDAALEVVMCGHIFFGDSGKRSCGHLKKNVHRIRGHDRGLLGGGTATTTAIPLRSTCPTVRTTRLLQIRAQRTLRFTGKMHTDDWGLNTAHASAAPNQFAATRTAASCDGLERRDDESAIINGG